MTLYTRSQCPLCEHAKQQLHTLQKEIPFQLIEKDISCREEWTERYGLMIPVVTLDDEIVGYGKIHLLDIKKRLKEKNNTR